MHAKTVGPSGHRGVALIIVLWVIVVLTIMAASFSTTMRREATLTANIKAQSRAGALAEAGVYYAMLMLLLNDPEQRWGVDGAVREFDFSGAKMKVRVIAETGKIDLNYADQGTLVKMFESVDVDEVKAVELADAILDWRDKNDLHRVNGAEQSEYEAEGKDYGPRNAPFETIEELQLVLGMDADIYTSIEDMITIYSKKTKVDLKKAPFKVLRVFIDEQELLDNSENNDDSDKPKESVKEGVAYGFYSQATLPDDNTGRILVVARRQKKSTRGFSVLRWKNVVADDSLFAEQLDEQPE